MIHIIHKCMLYLCSGVSHQDGRHQQGRQMSHDNSAKYHSSPCHGTLYTAATPGPVTLIVTRDTSCQYFNGNKLGDFCNSEDNGQHLVSFTFGVNYLTENI